MAAQVCEDPIEALIANSNVSDLKTIRQCLSDAKRLNITIEEAIRKSGKATVGGLSRAMAARELVLSGQMTLSAAINALRLANQDQISFDEARRRLRVLHRATKTVFTLTNELTSLMLEAGIITREQLGKAVDTATQTGLLTGRALRLNQAITSTMLASCIEGRILLRAKSHTEDEIIGALKFAFMEDITLNQALFEMGKFKQPSNYSMCLSDLLLMSGVLSEDDFLECSELSILKRKSFGQVALEQGLVVEPYLKSAEYLLSVVSSETLKPYEAAQVLRMVTACGASVYEAVMRAQVTRPAQEPLLLGDLLVDAGLVARWRIDALTNQDQRSAIKIGKKLLDAGLIREVTLFKALRCQSLWRLGYISRKSAIDSLKRSELDCEPLEKTFIKSNICVPSAMQWSWV